MSPSPPLHSRSTARSKWLALAACLFVVSVVAGSCSKSEPVEQKPKFVRVEGKPFQPPPGDRDDHGPLPDEVAGFKVTKGAAAGYVPDKACNECHADIFKSYQAMGMARSFYPPAEDNSIEDFGKPFYHDRSQRYYVMEWRDGKLYQRRYRLDSKGERYTVLEAQANWICGSGNHVRTYLHQNELGELFQLPMSWYTGIGWRMSPGYDQQFHNAFERQIDRGCMFCHNAYPEMPTGSDLSHKASVFPKQLPHGIGCQRCHGPGARHVALAQDLNAEDEAIRKLILNPANFTPQQKDDLCMSCHLQPEAIRGGMMPRHFDRPFFSFRPGDDLANYICYVDHDTDEERRDRFEINHHAYRFRQSKCFTASEGKMGCVTCHNPHKKIPKKEQAEHYRKKCFQCHKLSDCQMEGMGTTMAPDQANCISCHMVKNRPMDVVVPIVTDHLIRRAPPKDDLTAPREELQDVALSRHLFPYFKERSGKEPLWELYKGVAMAFLPEDTAMRQWREAFDKTRPHTVMAYTLVGRGLIKAKNKSLAIEMLEEGALNFPKVAEMHQVLGEAYLVAEMPEQAVKALETARDLDDTEVETHAALGAAYTNIGALRKGLASYERALAMRPIAWKTTQQYAATLHMAGDRKNALKHLKRAIELNPDDGESFLNMAMIYKEQGKTLEAIKVLEQGATHVVKAKLGLVTTYLEGSEHRDPQKALAIAKQVTKEHPDNGRGYLHLGYAMIGVNETDGMLPIIEQARAKGVDGACCAALQSLYWWQKANDTESDKAVVEFDRELRKPSDEPLRSVLRRMLEASRSAQRRR